ncbi:MAG: DNRLRE domain-containing protein [Clostridium sp.]
MKTLGYKATASTFVSSKYPYKNFSRDTYLCVGKNCGAHYEASSLMKFSLESYNINPYEIKRATLMIYLCGEIVSSESKVGIYGNLQDFSEKKVNYLTVPKEMKYVGEICIDPTQIKKYAMLDITDLCKFWVINPWYNYGITIKLLTDYNGYYLASCRNNPYPFIVIEYDC